METPRPHPASSPTSAAPAPPGGAAAGSPTPLLTATEDDGPTLSLRKQSARLLAAPAEPVALLIGLQGTASTVRWEGRTVRQYVTALADQGCWSDAAFVLARVMPRRMTVWWGTLAVRFATGATPPPAVSAALGLIERWVRQPGEETRWAAVLAGEQAGLATPVGCVAQAVLASGKSLTPPVLPPTPPPADLAARQVTAAVQFAALATGPNAAPARYRHLLQLGFDVADGNRSWKQPATR